MSSNTTRSTSHPPAAQWLSPNSTSEWLAGRSRAAARSRVKRTARNNRFDGYGVELFLDDDGDWLAHFSEMPNISAFGPTPEKALAELAAGWHLVKEAYQQERRPIPVPPSRRQYSGQFNVRIDKRVHRKLAIEAERNGVTLNALVAKKLAALVED